MTSTISPKRQVKAQSDARVFDTRKEPHTKVEAFSGIHNAGPIDLNPTDGILLFMNSGNAVAKVECVNGDVVDTHAVLPGSVVPFLPDNRPQASLVQTTTFIGVNIPSSFITHAEPTTDRRRWVGVSPFHAALTDHFYTQAMKSIWTELGRNSGHKRLLVQGAATALLGCILAKLEEGPRDPQPTICGDTAFEISELIDSEIGSPLIVSEVAKRFGYSPSEFKSNFRQAFGKTFKKYVVERRISKATQMSTQTNEAFAHIAIDCGFYDQSHMIHTFRRQIGCTPGQLRRKASLQSGESSCDMM